MGLRFTNLLGLRLMQEVSHGFLASGVNTSNLVIIRNRRTKHWDPKWKRLRRLKVMKVEIPDFTKKTEDVTEEDLRKELKKRHIMPPRPWAETTPFLHSTGGIFEPYVPPEGDGKVSPISKQGAMQSLTFLSKKSKTMMAIRKVRQFEEDFDTPKFCKETTEIYIKMHELLAKRAKEDIIDYVTETAYAEVIHNIDKKTIRWKYLKEIELPRVVQARCVDVITKENIFAQLTVRFHTQQTLAIYDRFGRLMHGSEILAKDVLEYVIFEKHLANEYGKWRIHGKIIPDWLPPKDPTARTIIRKIEPEEVLLADDKSIATTDKASVEKTISSENTSTPAIAS